MFWNKYSKPLNFKQISKLHNKEIRFSNNDGFEDVILNVSIKIDSHNHTIIELWNSIGFIKTFIIDYGYGIPNYGILNSYPKNCKVYRLPIIKNNILKNKLIIEIDH